MTGYQLVCSFTYITSSNILSRLSNVMFHDTVCWSKRGFPKLSCSEIIKFGNLRKLNWSFCSSYTTSNTKDNSITLCSIPIFVVPLTILKYEVLFKEQKRSIITWRYIKSMLTYVKGWSLACFVSSWGIIWNTSLFSTVVPHLLMKSVVLPGNFLYFVAWSKYWVLGARLISGIYFNFLALC